MGKPKFATSQVTVNRVAAKKTQFRTALNCKDSVRPAKRFNIARLKDSRHLLCTSTFIVKVNDVVHLEYIDTPPRIGCQLKSGAQSCGRPRVLLGRRYRCGVQSPRRNPSCCDELDRVPHSSQEFGLIPITVWLSAPATPPQGNP
jgi:hypothetical protein